jgi:hypothetical protein
LASSTYPPAVIGVDGQYATLGSEVASAIDGVLADTTLSDLARIELAKAKKARSSHT